LPLARCGAFGSTVLRERRVSVHIARGVPAGQPLRLPGQCQPDDGGRAAGDQYLLLEVLLPPATSAKARDL
jgi:curved DNA-binding protein